MPASGGKPSGSLLPGWFTIRGRYGERRDTERLCREVPGMAESKSERRDTERLCCEVPCMAEFKVYN